MDDWFRRVLILIADNADIAEIMRMITWHIDEWWTHPDMKVVENTFAHDPAYAYWYARDIIKGRWPEAEPAIAKDPYWARPYRELFSNRLDEIIRVTSYGKDRKPVEQTDDLINLMARKAHGDYVFTLSDDVNRGSLRALATRGMDTVGVVNMIQYSSKGGQAASQVTNVRVNKECKGVGLALYKFCLDSGLVLGCAPVQSTGGVYLWTKIATDPAYLVYAIDEKTGERHDVDVLDGELTSDVDLYDSQIHILLYAEKA